MTIKIVATLTKKGKFRKKTLILIQQTFDFPLQPLHLGIKTLVMKTIWCSESLGESSCSCKPLQLNMINTKLRAGGVGGA